MSLRNKVKFPKIINKGRLHFDDDSRDRTLDTTKLASRFDRIVVTLDCIQIALRANNLEMNQENNVILKYHGTTGQIQ